ncbi:hypothetical protein V7S43_001123 [Phytophthora oleae]|uniref:Cyclic nucleotide-binding domain-containing protein n=1 Tax=Phytophthora oleae TaxID=2107226 RepID=A0ABD3G4A6_9STRA
MTMCLYPLRGNTLPRKTVFTPSIKLKIWRATEGRLRTRKLRYFSTKLWTYAWVRSTIDRWKAAVFQITRVRSPWTSMLQDNFYLRSQLTLIMIHLLPLFKDIPRQQCLEMCKYCSVEVMPLDSSVFERGDEVLDHFFLIISGSVTMQQLLSPSLQASATTGLDSRARVSVRVLKCGDSFGEVELMLNTSKRLIDAVVSSNRTKLHRVPKYLFCRVWPVQEDLESKLMTIKRAFDAASPLEPEQLCSIYYSAINCSFTRNEVVLGANTQRGTLLVIESGFCVVHDYITLQRKRPRKPAQRDSFQSRTPAPKLALDTRVASLGPSSILLAEFDLTTDTPTNLPDGEYIVAESPIVNAFTVELYPKASEAPATAPSRRHDLLIATLLGRGGLQTVRAAIATQHDRRTESAGVLMRLAEATVPKEKFAEVFSPSVSPLKRNMDTTNMTSDGKTPMQMELHHYLRDRQLPRNPRQPRSTKKSICLVTVGPTALPTKSLGISTGSFAIPTIDGRAKGLFPVLRPVGRCPDVGQHETQSYLDPAVVAASMRSTQLIKESRVIAELSHHSQEILGPRLNTAMEKRQRHGRPPSRQLESRDRLIDVLTPDTNFDNDRRRTEFCRRLLHLKSSDGHK